MPVALPSAPSATCSSVWLAVPSQNGSWHSELGGIAAISATDMWAVGTSLNSTPTTFGPGHQNLTEHWDGKFWSTVPAPQPGPDDNVLNDVAAVATNDVWAVGFSNTTGTRSGVALHWTGTSWATTPLPATPLNGPTELNDVVAFAANDVWAAGTQLAYNSTNTSVRHPLVLHWTGAAWQYVAVPTQGEGDSLVYGVGGSSTSDLYAVGFSQASTSSLRQELILHWNGTAWTATALPNGGVSKTLWSVAALSTTDAMAVGLISGASNATLAERSINGGTSWTSVGIAMPSTQFNALGDVAAVPPSGYDAVGFTRATWTSSTTYSAAQPLFGAWSGTAWTFSAGQAYGDSAFFSLATPAGGGVWAVGDKLLANGLEQTLIESYNGLGAPAGVVAAAADKSATVNWTAPPCDGGSAITQYVVFAYDGCTTQSWILSALTSANFTGLTNGTSFTFRVAAVNGFGMGPLSAASSAVTPAGTAPTWVTACSRQQYSLAGSNGGTWQDIDPTNLTVSFTPGSDGFAILSGNADLWTDTAGYNQDLGISVTGTGFPTAPGQPEGWKESGGFAGTYSPNAGYVQTVISVKAAVTYTARLQWKANISDPGKIFAGAGPLTVYPGDCYCPGVVNGYSPTRLTVQLVPGVDGVVFSKTSTQQYQLPGSSGLWLDMDATNLTLQFVPPAQQTQWTAYISGNADRWTQSAGYNQDLGIALSGGGVFPSTPGQPEAWKESGGFAGTFSPNAAFVQTVQTVTGGTTYTAKLQWKANKPDPGTIFAGAGPIGPKFSPTSLTVILVPVGNSSAASSTAQYSQVNSDGTYWQPIDPALKFTLTPSTASSYQLTANADLWTANAGYNQDVGIMVSGGPFGGGTLVAWKESGGFAGTYSPNAGFVTSAVHLPQGPTYTVWAVWKANIIPAAANQIYIGAGPIGAKYSPTSLTAVQLSSP